MLARLNGMFRYELRFHPYMSLRRVSVTTAIRSVSPLLSLVCCHLSLTLPCTSSFAPGTIRSCTYAACACKSSIHPLLMQVSLLVRPASRPPARSRVGTSVVANYWASTSVVLRDATFPHSPSRPVRSSVGCSSPSPLSESLQLLYSADNQGLRLGLCCTQVSFPLTKTLIRFANHSNTPQVASESYSPQRALYSI